jgi:hypothetical protein
MRQIAPGTNLLAFWRKPGHRLPVLQKHERNVSIVRTVRAVRKIPRSFGHRYARLLIFRISDFAKSSQNFRNEPLVFGLAT